MAAENTVEIKIKATSDDAKLHEFVSKLEGAKVQIQGLGEKAREGTENVGLLSGGISKLAGMAAGVLSLGQAFVFVKDSIKAAAEGERSLRNLVSILDSYGGGTAEAKAATIEWIETLDRLTGIPKERLIPEFQKLLGVTEDLAASKAILTMAVGAEADGMGSLETVVGSLSAAMSGMDMRGRELILIKIKQAKEAGNLKEVLTGLISKYADAGLSIDDTTRKLDVQKQAWNNTKEALGAAFAPALKVTGDALMVVAKVVAILSGSLIELMGYLQASYYVAADMAIKVAELPGMVKKVWGGDYKGAWADFKASAAETFKGAEQILDEYDSKTQAVFRDVDRAWDKSAGNVKLSSAEIESAVKRVQELLNSSGGDGSQKKAADAAAKAERAKYAAMDADIDRFKRFNKIQEADRQTRIAAQRREADLLIGINRAYWTRVEKDGEAAQARMLADDARYWQRVILIQKGAETKLDKMDLSELKEFAAIRRQELAAYKGDALQRIAIEQQAAAAEKAIAKQTAADKVQSAMEATAGVLGAASQAFGNNKQLAIASAILDTIAGAQAAFRHTPGPLYVQIAAAATALLMGYARVQQIKSTEFEASGEGGGGGGFDTPEHDAAAYAAGVIGGHRWANDMVHNYAAGIGEGWAAGLSRDRPAGITNNNQRTTHSRNTVVNAQFMTPAAGRSWMRSFARDLRGADRDYDRAIVNRRVVTLGSKRAR